MYEFSNDDDDDDEWLFKGEEEDEMEGEKIDDEPDLSYGSSQSSHDVYFEDEGTREYVRRKRNKGQIFRERL